MRKRSKPIALAAAAAILTLGSSFAAFADWQQIDNNWIFTDSSGNRLTNTWRTSGAHEFYLGSDGIMLTSQWIDNTYYVNEDGARVVNQWIFTAPGTYNAPSSEGGWFYVGANGRAVTDGWQTINGQRYHFNEEGRMDYGWFTEGDNLYYLGDQNDGAMKTGWLALEWDEDYIPSDGEVSMIVDSGEMGAWFYFQDNGRAVRATDGGYVNRRINGYRYYFDENGVMATGWKEVAERQAGDSTGISTLKYFGTADQGQMTTGWRYIYEAPGEDDDDDDFRFNIATPGSYHNYEDYDGDGAWYYFNSSGVPAYLNENAETLTDATTRVNSQSYFFDRYGRMQSGLLGFRLADGSILTAYFGADDSDGAMKRDRQTNVYDYDGERSTYYFNSSGVNRGSGYTGERNGYLYYNGKLVTAEDGYDLAVYRVGGQLYLVNESGRVQNSNRTYRVDGEWRYEYSNGTIYYINENRERIGEVTEGERLPVIYYKDIYDL